MPKLCQIIALNSGRKSEVEKAVTEFYKVVQKPELFSGFERAYRSHDAENGEKLPGERQKVQFTADNIIEQAKEKWSELWDLTATLDCGNQAAVANVVVDGAIVLPKVPVTTLLFLEKQVNDLETFINKLPIPDAAETWVYDPNIGLLRSGAQDSVRTKKEPAHYVKAEATKEHPAQVEYFHKDVPVGTWTKTAFSGAISADKKQTMLVRVKKLKDAIKVAREEANLIDVDAKKIGESVFNFVLQ